MSVRQATGDDVEAVQQLAERSWTTDYPEILTRESAEEAVTVCYAP
jgi:hypothetical protein